jgi:hypothetical protein
MGDAKLHQKLFFIMQNKDDGARLNFCPISIAGVFGLFSTS